MWSSTGFRSGCLGIFIMVIHCGLAVADTVPQHVWSHVYGGGNSDGCSDVATDSAGNAYLTGSCFGTANFGGADLVTTGDYDAVLAKYDAAGNHLWSRLLGMPDNGGPYGVAVDSSGNIVVTGYFYGTANFGGTDLISAGGLDIFLAKFDTDGNHVWSKRFGRLQHDYGNQVTTDDSGNIYFTGQFQEAVDFGGGNLISAGDRDIALAKFAPDGTHLWSKCFGGTLIDNGQSVAIDSSGNLVLSANFQVSADFGGGTIFSAGGSDIVLAKYDPNGVHLWSQRIGGAGDEFARMNVDANDNILIGGGFSQTLSLGGTALVSNGDRDILFAKFDTDGGYLWSRSFGGAMGDNALRLTGDMDGGVIAVGVFQGTVDFGGGAMTSAGGYDVFFARLDSLGTHDWSRSYGSTSYDYGYCVAQDASGDILLGIQIFETAVDFGGGPLSPLGHYDVFLAKFELETIVPPVPPKPTVTDIGNDQGRQVRVSWPPFTDDAPGVGYDLEEYLLYRRIDGFKGLNETPADTPEGSWDFVGSVPATGEDEYNLVVPTLCDSTQAGVCWSVFFVRATTSSPYVFFDTPPDSGYSVDNLAPGVPTKIAAAYGSGGVAINWDDAPDTDFQYFRVYRSTDPMFIPSPETLVHETATSVWDDPTAEPWGYNYKITALDFAGNESEAGSPSQVTGVQDGKLPAKTTLLGAVPNPFNPSTKLSFVMVAPGYTRLKVYDTAGRLVATLVDEHRDAGSHHVIWKGRDDTGRMSSAGVYLYRLEVGDFLETKRMTLIK